MKSVLISIQPKWCELIATGKKTIEVRKTRPKIDTPLKCYIYCTLPPQSEFFWHHDEEGHRTIGDYANELIRLPNGKIVYDYGMRLALEDGDYTQDNFLCQKVIGEFVCDGIMSGFLRSPWSNFFKKQSCLTYKEIKTYGKDKPLHFWHISNLKIYDKPKEIGEFVSLRKTKFGYQPIKLTRPPQSWCYVDEWSA